MRFALPAPHLRRKLLLSIAALGLLGTFAATVPFQNKPQAAAAKQDGELHADKHQLQNYDIRTDQAAQDKLDFFRAAANRTAASAASDRQAIRAAENALRSRVPSLKVEYNDDLRIPEVIAPDVLQGKAILAARTNIGNSKRSSGKGNSQTLRQFISENNRLVGLDAAQIADLNVTADYTNPDGNLSFAHLEQTINGIPVFRGEIKAGFNRRGEMFRVINNLAPNLDYNSVSKDFGDPAKAVQAAFQFVSRQMRADDANFNKDASTDLKAVFGAGDWATIAEKMYFPVDSGAARAAWRVLVWEDKAAYYVIVDHETGAMLWRKNISEDQTQPVTYNVYSGGTSMMKILDSPAPLTPGPISPALGTQGAIQPRNTVSFVGNEAPYTFNNNGWVIDNANVTDGNAVEAGLDRVSPDGIDATVTGSGTRSFVFNYNPAPGIPAPGDDPLGVEYQKGIVTQLFYTTNRYHDEMYLLGFTEAARNFQADNFGRGGSGADRVSAQAQDYGGTNNANFSSPADGSRGRMQMYIWTPPTPDRDGDLDADIVIHELTHGTSNRLHGNSSGLGTNMARGMGEGWGDFYGHALLSEPSDPLDGVYTTGGYATLNLRTGAPFSSTGNYYYGIRRFPKAIMSATGGAANRPHNPMTFGDIDARRYNINDGAFAPAFPVSLVDQVHAAGEVWSTALWEARAKLIERLGAAEGNRKALQYVTDGMKLAPLNPTFLSERDAIIAAAQASGTAGEVADLWSGFAKRGMGVAATVSAGTGAANARTVESFDVPNLYIAEGFSFSDASGNNNGIAEPGERITLNVSLKNPTNSSAVNSTLSIVNAGTTDFGTIAANATETRQINFIVPRNAGCGSDVTIQFSAGSSLGSVGFSRKIRTGTPIVTFSENFDGVTAPALPAGWTTAQTGGGTVWTNAATAPNSQPNAPFVANVAVAGTADLISPAIPIGSSNAILTFTHNFNTEPGYDGGLLEIKIGDGAWADIEAAGGAFLDAAYSGRLADTTNPNYLRNAYTGNIGSYLTTSVRLPTTANGQNVQLRWRLSTDTGVGASGWYVDDVKISQGSACAVSPAFAAPKSRADFDGDGRSDVSVFRSGTWFVQRSTEGFSGLNWGVAGDAIVPGDYDGDLKADFVIFRATQNSDEADFYILQSSDNLYRGISWGVPGDKAYPGDFNGDNRADFAVYRQSNNTWYVLPSNGGAPLVTSLGNAGDVPVVLDYDGDLKTDLAMWNQTTGVWTIRKADGSIETQTWGAAGDRAVPADYDNDNKDDLAVYRGEGQWWIRQSSNGETRIVNFGVSGDVPVPGDYDGDGADDPAVYRNGQWYMLGSTSGFAATNFGLQSDVPIANRYLP